MNMRAVFSMYILSFSMRHESIMRFIIISDGRIRPLSRCLQKLYDASDVRDSFVVDILLTGFVAELMFIRKIAKRCSGTK